MAAETLNAQHIDTLQYFFIIAIHLGKKGIGLFDSFNTNGVQLKKKDWGTFLTVYTNFKCGTN